MKRALPLVLVLCFGCPDSVSKPTFVQVGSPGGGIGPGAVGSVTSVTVGSSTTSTGAGMVANCECIYEASNLTVASQTCKDCVSANTLPTPTICYQPLADCTANADCELGLMTAQNIPADAAAIEQLYSIAGADGGPLLLAYFNCLCSDPGACASECHNAGSTCTGLGGAGGTGASP